MAKKYAAKNKAQEKQKPDGQAHSAGNLLQPDAAVSPAPIPGWLGIAAAIILFFILALAGSMDNILEKWTGLLAAVIIVFFLFTSKRTVIFKKYITPLFFAITAYIIWGGISTFYAATGKFAIFEFSKLLVALCVYLFVLFFTEPDERGFKQIAYIFASVGCFFGILSVDAASFGILTRIFRSIISLFTKAYDQYGGFEQGIRISSIIGNPNIYAGFMAIAVFLSLYLVVHASDRKNAKIAASLLAVNSLSYLLAFSMGSLFMFLIACLIMIGFTEKGNRVSLFLVMLETAGLSFVFAFVSMFGLGKAGFVALVPLIALVLNAFLLFQLDVRLRSSLSEKMKANSKVLYRTVVLVVVLGAVYTAAAFIITGSLTLSANQSVMRAVYIPGGQYTMSVESTAPANIRIESQNQYDLMRRSSTVLYNGTNEQPITFTVPDDSKIVKVNFISAADGIRITDAAYRGSVNGKIHLNYPLLPNIIANRIQDLRANENMVQRTVFFEDGMKLFAKSPVIGRGLGGFENGIYSVQSFYYETKYAHNHYIQVLSDLGIIGFLIFISMLVFSAVSVFKARRSARALYAVPVLAASVFQMFGQALTDAIWSTGIFLGFAAAILALVTIFCSEPLKLKESFNKDAFRIAEKTAIAVFTGVFILLLSGNLYSQAQVKNGVKDFSEIDRYIMLDRFEYNDYKLSYIVNAPMSKDPKVLAKAARYASDLTNVESNSLTPYIVAYEFQTYMDADAFKVAENGIERTKSYPNAWIRLFDTFEEYIDPVGAHKDDAVERLKGAEPYVNGVLSIYDKLLERNKNSLDDVILSPYNDAFIGKLLEIRATHLYSVDWVFTAMLTYAFDSVCAVDANQDGLPDAMTVQAGSAKGGENGIITVTGNTVADFNLYHKLGGKYTFKIETQTPQEIAIAFNGQPQNVIYDKRAAYAEINLDNNSDMALSKVTVTFPSDAQIDAITFTTVLE